MRTSGPEIRGELEELGRERALIYKTLVLTGLRRNELATLTVVQLRLDGPNPFAALDAADEKNRQGNGVPIRPALAEDLSRWLDDKLAAFQSEARRLGAPIPARLPSSTLLFTVPVALVKILNRDLKAAGIPKRDDRGRTLDVHALRHTLGTFLSKYGVPLRTAQAAMRHSDPKLTANTYTAPRLLDVAGALDALPNFPLDRGNGPKSQRATGTDPNSATSLAPPLAPTRCKRGQSASLPGKATAEAPTPLPFGVLAANPFSDNDKGSLTSGVSEPSRMCPAGLEPATFSFGG